MKRIKLLFCTLFRIGPNTFFKFLTRSIYEYKVVYHYKLPLNNVRLVPKKVQIESKIYYTFWDLDETIKREIRDYFGFEKLRVFKERLNYTSDIVVSFINGKLASFCFFAYSEETFQFFTLPEREIYFYDCFTFPEFRGLNAVYWEVKFVTDFFKNRGFTYANVEIESQNNPSIRAFTKVGFYKIYEFYLKRFLFFEKVVRK